MSVTIVEVEPGIFLTMEDGCVAEARVDGEIVTISGVRYAAVTTDPRKWNPAVAGGQTQGRTSLKAPMPGKVVRVLVRVDDKVNAGQGLIVVEAMKMQNELKSPFAGTVTEVHAKENDTVEAGALLLVVESG